MLKLIFILLTAVISVQASADVLTDFDGLGDNKELMDKAKALNPEVKVNVVQDRVVKRRNRFEIAPEIAKTTGGDSYISTFGYGANVHFHITPMWSVGVKYTYFTNELTKEGENIINDVATGKNQGIIPDIDQPKDQTMALVNWYPIYGKLNLMNMGITHFDIYGTAGYGTMTLKNGNSPTWTAGAGVGLWFSQHLTSRFEIRYQNYTAKRYTSDDSMNTVVGSFQFGYIL